MTSIIDGAMVGFFYGSHGLAAVGAGGPILSVFTIAAGILGTGNSVICSNLIGKASKEEANKAFALAILWSLIISVLFTALCLGYAGGIAEILCLTAYGASGVQVPQIGLKDKRRVLRAQAQA